MGSSLRSPTVFPALVMRCIQLLCRPRGGALRVYLLWGLTVAGLGLRNCCEVPMAVEERSEWLLQTISVTALHCLLEPVVCGRYTSWDSGHLLFFSLPLSSLSFLHSLFFYCPSPLLSVSLHLCTPILNFYSNINRAIILCHHLAAAVPWGSGPCSAGKKRWDTPTQPWWAQKVDITGSLGGNGLEVCVSENTPTQAGLIPQTISPRLRGLGGCRDSVLGEQRGLWVSRGD